MVQTIKTGGRCISTDFGLLSNGSLHILFKQMRENHEDFSSGNGLVATNGAGIMRIDYPGARCESIIQIN